MRGNWTQAASWIVCWGGKLLGDDNSKSLLKSGSRPEMISGKLEAASGFEPLHRGFADLSLNHLGTPPSP